MITYYCKKCGTDNHQPFCEQCGKKLTGSTMHSVWAVRRLPLTDGSAWLLALAIGCTVSLLLLALIIGAEFFLTGTDKMLALWRSDLPMLILMLIPLSLLFTGLMLVLQGREVVSYSLESYGVIQRTWHGASHIKCWARFIHADLSQATPDENGQPVVMGHERVTLWKDVKQVRYIPRRAEIRLYHCMKLAPMVLRIPQEEYTATESLVKKFCKNK